MNIFYESNRPRLIKIVFFVLGMITMAMVYEFGMWFSDNYRFQPLIVPRIISPVDDSQVIERIPTTTPTPKTQSGAKLKGKTAIVTAYSCGGLTTDEEIDMNCPSLRNHPQGRTATGTTPIPYKTIACDKENLGRTFHLEGIGQVICEDTGGAIKGAGRFDLYVESVEDARKFGRKTLSYYLVK